MNMASPRARKDGKTHWHSVGSAWIDDNGGTTLEFDSLPLPDAEGRVRVRLFEPRDNNISRGTQPAPQQRQTVDLDDSLPPF
jgi:hypothetical protein